MRTAHKQGGSMSWFRTTSLTLVVLATPVVAYAQQGALVAPGPVQAVSTPAITFNVPVQLKEMIALGAIVKCRIYGEDASQALGEGSQAFEIPNGEVDQIVQVVVSAGSYGNFVGAKSYTCFLLVSPSPSAGYSQSPYQSTPAPNQDHWRMARPDRPFQASVTGPLSGAVMSGPGTLQNP
jgi:hypothetical protein